MGFKDLWEQFYEILLENCKEHTKIVNITSKF